MSALDAGPLAIDGGAMHGVVPKPLWERAHAPDALNRIALAHRVLLLEGHGMRVLVEAGSGGKWDAKGRERFGLAPDGDPLQAALAARGAAPESIDLLLVSHLHFDHAGGATRLGADGAVEPAFPRARVVATAREVADALAPNERNHASYLAPENVAPLAGRLDGVEGETEVAPGLFLVPTPGHTPGHASVRVEGDVKGLDADGIVDAWFLGDLVPTAAHLRLAWIMAFDLEPLVTLATKKKVLARVADAGSLAVFDHDRERGAGTLARAGREVALAQWWKM